MKKTEEIQKRLGETIERIRHTKASGEEAGPLPKVSLTAKLKEQLRIHPQNQTLIAQSLIKQGIGGNLKAIQELFDRIDGRPVERHEIDGQLPIRLIFVPAQQLLARTKTAIEEARGQTEEARGQTVEGEYKVLGQPAEQ